MEVIAGPTDAGTRLDILLKSAFPEYSRSAIQKAIRQGLCWQGANQITDPAVKISSGQRFVLEMPETEIELEPSQGTVEIVWQDDCLAICAKPPGLTVHPCPSCHEETLVHRLLAKFPQLSCQGGQRPGIVHRLDKDTSGLLLVALSEECRLALAEAFAAREVEKEYLALVAGVPQESGICSEPIGRHPAMKTRMAVIASKLGGRQARTEWRRLWHNGRISLLAVRIRTGRTHQIRVHLAHLGHPLLGDTVYAPANIAKLAPRQMLHAWRLGFKHPLTGAAMRFLNIPSNDFFEVILANAHSMQKVIITGNQGCGKSTFCRALANLGAPVISADQIVADMYAKKSAATDWIATHLGPEAIATDGSVDKTGLFGILQERPLLRREFEIAIHGLVFAAIEQFWQASETAPVAVAEIPLYFESNYQKLIEPAPLVVGISCPQPTRWHRIAATRGWSNDKIATLEQWQWPEDRKMAACDQVIANTGTAEVLKDEAKKFLTDLEARRKQAQADLLAMLKGICADASHLRECQNPAKEHL